MADDLNLATLLRRVEALEGRLRVARATVVLALSLSAFASVWAVYHERKNEPAVLEATGLNIRDKSGQVRVGIKAEELRIFDSGGHPRTALMLDGEENPNLVLFDKNARIRTLLYINSDGTPHFELSDTAESPRLVAALNPEGYPHLELHDTKKSVRAHLMLGENENPMLGMLDGAGRLRAVIGIASDGLPIVQQK